MVKIINSEIENKYCNSNEITAKVIWKHNYAYMMY